MDRERCGHQDLIQLSSGRGLLVARNTFGIYRRGATQMYLVGRVGHVTIVNNVFRGTDPRVPGYRVRVALIVGSRGQSRVPLGVKIVNNTILAGEDPHHVCSVARAAVANVVLRGVACRGTNRGARVRLDAKREPTSASEVLIDRASRQYAPTLDFTGRRRGSKPDIGAYEYVGKTPVR